ncbi:MAG: M18 family aminopeptidase [Acidimicrobiales bacterium]
MAAKAEGTELDPGMVARDLMAFLDAAPTPYHAVAEAGRRLADAGFTAVAAGDDWVDGPDRGYVIVGGALVAWSVPGRAGPATPFRLVGAHTDSPNLRIRPQPDTGRAGWRQLGVEVYGGALVNSWLDRDLGLAGRVAVRGHSGPDLHLVRVDRPILRVPQLAIHLDRDIGEKGLLLNRQLHLSPVWGLGAPDPGAFARFLAKEIGVPDDDVLSWDVMAFDLTRAALGGIEAEFVSSARLDNLCSCHAAVSALAAPRRTDEGGDASIAVVSLFDHEEVGSTSTGGADSVLLSTVLERLVLARGGQRDDFLRALAGSRGASADMAHATHPNYVERHEPDHTIAVNAGPVVQVNVNQRYATDGPSQAGFEQACADAGVPVQRFVSRGTCPCGSTIGPLTAARLGIPTVDVGIAQLAMHSARELCGSVDPALYVRALTAWLG